LELTTQLRERAVGMNEKTVLITLLALITAVLLVTGVFVFYPSLPKSLSSSIEQLAVPPNDRFSDLYEKLSISRLPASVERQPAISGRLEQLNREPCYRDAISELSDALLNAGFPRESAVVLISFANRCPGSDHLLAGAYNALMAVSDATGAAQIADKLVNRFPAQSTYRYWRARAYDDLGDYQHALGDYLNAVQLVGDLNTVSGDAFFNLSRMYAALGRYCDAITPMQTYVYLNPAERRTPQTVKIIAEYADKGHCDPHFAQGLARVPFLGRVDVHALPVSINNVIGNFVLDTGATFVSVTAAFAERSKISTEARSQITMKTVGGMKTAEMGRASTVAVGRAGAFDVPVAVIQNDRDPFGERLDGLLGMSYLARFDLKLSRNGIELTPLPIR
jgi:tetratricopeptide (TPR) repeat protein